MTNSPVHTEVEDRLRAALHAKADLIEIAPRQVPDLRRTVRRRRGVAIAVAASFIALSCVLGGAALHAGRGQSARTADTDPGHAWSSAQHPATDSPASPKPTHKASGAPKQVTNQRVSFQGMTFRVPKGWVTPKSNENQAAIITNGQTDLLMMRENDSRLGTPNWGKASSRIANDPWGWYPPWWESNFKFVTGATAHSRISASKNIVIGGRHAIYREYTVWAPDNSIAPYHPQMWWIPSAGVVVMDVKGGTDDGATYDSKRPSVVKAFNDIVDSIDVRHIEPVQK